MPFRRKDVIRFETKFSKGLDTECWEWRASRFSCGYGQFRARESRQAHRFAYRLYVGSIPKGMCVLHKCDNKACVNPSHLFLGSFLDNTRDMVKKGRGNFGCSQGPIVSAKGESHGMSCLTETDVLDIRRRYQRTSYHGSNARDLAKEFGISHNQITRIARRKRWVHI